jgi:TrmH family RNA methyltransferase
VGRLDRAGVSDPGRITSPANPRLRAATALRDARERRRTGRTLVDGAREARRALDAGVAVVEAFVCEPLLAGEDAAAALAALRQRRIPVVEVAESAFVKLAFGDRAEGIVLVVEWAPAFLEALELPSDPFLLVLEGVEKPGNLGAVLRTADGAGVHAVIAASPRSDLANPNVVRASAGTLFAVPVASGPSEAVLAWLRARRIRPVAARVEAPRAYTDAVFTGGIAIVLGAEDEGLSEVWSGDDIDAVRLPMHGVADSLNVSVTAAVLAYEARRQRDRHPGRPA